MFAQLTSKISEFSLESFCLPHRMWKVKFIGESVDDCGGGFSESIAEICDELQNGSLPLLLQAPNNTEASNMASDHFIINPAADDKTHKEMFRFLGKYKRDSYQVVFNMRMSVYELAPKFRSNAPSRNVTQTQVLLKSKMLPGKKSFFLS